MPGGIAARCSECQVFLILKNYKICAIVPPMRQFGGKYINLFGVKLGERVPKTIFRLRGQGGRIISDYDTEQDSYKINFIYISLFRNNNHLDLYKSWNRGSVLSTPVLGGTGATSLEGDGGVKALSHPPILVKINTFTTEEAYLC